MIFQYFKNRILSTSPFKLGLYWTFGLSLLLFYYVLVDNRSISGISIDILLLITIATVMFGSMVMGVIFSDLKKTKGLLASQLSRLSDFEGLMKRWSSHDELTGLVGRSTSKSMAKMLIEDSLTKKYVPAIIVIDINNFRVVNEGLGESGGNFVLVHVANLLRKYASFGDVVSRQGGDEFMLIVGNAIDHSHLKTKLSSLIDDLSLSINYEGTQLYTTYSIGVYFVEGSDKSIDSMYRKAISATKHAKKVGGNAIKFFDANMETDMLDELNTVTRLQEAIKLGQFEVMYQPFFDCTTMKLSGCEALIRWNHPEMGQIQPSKFIPVAERTGLICEIGEWVIRDVCKRIDSWKNTSYSNVIVAINLSAVQFKRDDLVDFIQKSIIEFDINPELLEFEITESALIDDADLFVSTLSRIKNLGVRLSIDDFGTGYSNLGYLQKFEIDKLKIDRVFVNGIVDNHQDKAIVNAIIQMGHGLGLSVIAEGVENNETLAQLQSLGCDLGQGYLYGKPKNASSFESFFDLKKNESVSAT